MIEAAKQGMGKDETSFTDEATIDRQTYLWSDKYRPRKPRYFNRVHTGFDWNKYNQTHYDIDNPPPKIVQGYRFNVGVLRLKLYDEKCKIAEISKFIFFKSLYV